MADFYINQGDTSPSLVATLKGSNGQAKDLTNATVVFKVGTDPDNLIVNKTVTPFAASGGIMVYDWESGETDTAGTYLFEFEVTYSDNTKETFPNDDQLFIAIKPNKL